MIVRLAFLAARLVAGAIFLLTWAYGVTTRSAFAFDMFVKPQLSPTLASFVTWHPAVFGFAYLLSAITLVPTLRAPAASTRQRAARTAAIGYVAVFGGVTLWLVRRPHLASLAGGDHNLLVVPGALLPLLWLAMIDHLAAPRTEAASESSAVNQQTLLRASVASAIILWIAHVSWSWFSGALSGGLAGKVAGAGWSLLLDLAVGQVVYLALAFASTVAPRRDRSIEYWLVVVLAAVAVGEFVRRLALPPLALLTPIARLSHCPSASQSP